MNGLKDGSLQVWWWVVRSTSRTMRVIIRGVVRRWSSAMGMRILLRILVWLWLWLWLWRIPMVLLVAVGVAVGVGWVIILMLPLRIRMVRMGMVGRIPTMLMLMIRILWWLRLR